MASTSTSRDGEHAAATWRACCLATFLPVARWSVFLGALIGGSTALAAEGRGESAVKLSTEDQRATLPGNHNGDAALASGDVSSSQDRVAELSPPPGAAGLKSISHTMQQAEIALRTMELAGTASRMQQTALTAIDDVLAQLDQQCQRCAAQLGKPGPPKQGSDQPGRSAADASATTLDKTLETTMSSYVDDVWGRLPERQRNLLLSPLGEEFIPEYAEDVKLYFRGLADPQRAGVQP